MGSRRAIAAVAASGALALAGCGGGSKPTSAPTSTATARRASATAPVSPAAPVTTAPGAKAATVNYGQQYLAILAPYNAFATKNQNATITPALTSQTESILTTTATKLTTATWPLNAQADIRSFVSDMAAMNAALQHNDNDSFQTASDQAQSAANFVRHDLGLPPA